MDLTLILPGLQVHPAVLSLVIGKPNCFNGSADRLLLVEMLA